MLPAQPVLDTSIAPDKTKHLIGALCPELVFFPSTTALIALSKRIPSTMITSYNPTEVVLMEFLTV